MFIALLLSCVAQESLQPAEGFISLHPSITETFYTLGAEKQLRGRSDYCKSPEAATTLPTFGTSITPNFERLAAANVANIVGDRAIAQHEEALAQIGTLHSLPWLSIEDMKQSISTLGLMTNTKSNADKLINELAETFQSQPDGESVLLLLSGSVISKGQLWYIKPESIHGSMLEASGYQNAISTSKDIPQMSIEELLNLNPPVIALLGNSEAASQMATQKEDLMALTSLQAVENNRICLLSINNPFGTGPSIVQTVPHLKEQLSTCLR